MKKEFIYLGADHGGNKTKEEIKKYFNKKNISYEDIGALTLEKKDDYPKYAKKVAKKILKHKGSKGILICGSGTGMSIAANRHKGIRATIGYDQYSAKMSRKDNDSNILCLRGRKFNLTKTKRIINTWLNTPFSDATRHKKRIKQLDK